MSCTMENDENNNNCIDNVRNTDQVYKRHLMYNLKEMTKTNNILSNFVNKVILLTKRFRNTKTRIKNNENRIIINETSTPIIKDKLAEIKPLKG